MENKKPESNVSKPAEGSEKHHRQVLASETVFSSPKPESDQPRSKLTGKLPNASTREIKALCDEDRKAGKPGLAQNLLAMLEALKKHPHTHERDDQEKNLKSSITEMLAPQLKHLREKLFQPRTGQEVQSEKPILVSQKALEDHTKQTVLTGNASESSEQVRTAVQLLEKALHAPGSFGLPFGEHVDFNRLKELVGGLTIDDRMTLVKAFEQESKSKTSFFNELKWLGHSSPLEVQEVEGLFMRRRGLTDWASDLQSDVIKLRELNERNKVAGMISGGLPAPIRHLEQTKLFGVELKDPQIANVEHAMRQTVAMMPEQAIKELKSRHPELYKSLISEEVVGRDTREALKIMTETPGWAKSLESVTSLVRIALKSNNYELFKDAMMFSSAKTRDDFSKTSEAQQAKSQYVLNHESVEDLISKGSESLATSLHLNTRAFGWLGANREEIDRLVETCDSSDRLAFTAGEQLSHSTKAFTKVEQEQVNFFRSVDAALKQATLYDKTQYDLLKHKLLDAPEIYEQLRMQHSDGILGAFQKNNFSGMKKVVENISEEEWKQLRNNPEEVKKLDQGLKEFLNPLERIELLQMLTDKLGDAQKDKLTFEQSKELGKRSIEKFFKEEVAENSWDKESQKKCRLAKLERLTQLTNDEKNEYRKNPDVLNKLVKETFEPKEAIIANRLLQQVIKNDNKKDLVCEALFCDLRGENGMKRARALEAALTTIDLGNFPKTAEDRKLQEAFSETIKEFCDEAGLGPKYGRANQLLQAAQYDRYIKETFETGRVSISLKRPFINDSPLAVTDITGLDTAEKKRLFSDDQIGGALRKILFKTPEQATLARELQQFKDPKDVPEFMRIRAAVVGFDEPVGKIVEKLASMTPSELRRLENDYLRYHSILSSDLLHVAKGADRRELADIYAKDTLGQKLVTQGHELTKQDGLFDPLLIAGAREAHSRTAKVYAENKELMSKLDAPTREKIESALENYFLAKSNYIQTKRETAEAVSEATTMLLAVAVSIADPPATAAILTSAGVVGGSVKLGMTRAMMGSDFDESKALKIAASGFLDVSFGFADKVIPISKLIKIDAKVAAEASEAVCNKLSSTSAQSSLKTDAKNLLAREMSEMSRTHCAFGTKEFEHEVKKVAASILESGADDKAIADVANLISKETKNRISANLKQRLRNELYKAGESSSVETASGVTKESILDPDKIKSNELAIKSTSEMVNSLLKCMEMRVAGKAFERISEHTKLELAKHELFTSVKNALPEKNFKRVIEHAKVLEERLNDPKETAECLRQISHFFKPRPKGLDIDLSRVPSESMKAHLGESTLFELAYPQHIRQGFHSTCNAAIIQKNLAFENPAKYAQIAARTSVFDVCDNAHGSTFKPSEFGAFISDEESSIFLGRRNDWKSDEDIRGKLFRPPNSKAMQTSIINSYWQSADRELHVLERDGKMIIANAETPGAERKTFGAGEIAFFGTKEGHQLRYKKDGEWKPFYNDEIGPDNDLVTHSTPQLGSEHLQSLKNQLAGKDKIDDGFVLIGPVPENANQSTIETLSKSQTFVANSEDLKSILINRHEKGSALTSIAVDSGKLYPGQDGGPHVILARYNQASDGCKIFDSFGQSVESDVEFTHLFNSLLKETFDGTPE